MERRSLIQRRSNWLPKTEIFRRQAAPEIEPTKHF